MAGDFRVEGAVGAGVGGVLLVVGHLLNYLGTEPTGTALGKGSVFAGHLVLVFAFVGIYLHQTRRDGAPVGWVGMVSSIVGTILVTAIVFVELAGASGVDTTPVFEAVGTDLLYTAGPLVFVVGLLAVGASITRRDELPPLSGGLLIVGTIVFAGASFLTEYAALLTLLGAAVTAAGFVWVGATLYTTDSQIGQWM